MLGGPARVAEACRARRTFPCPRRRATDPKELNVTRRLPLALAALVASLFCVFALAMPASATEAEDPNLEDGTADWTGTILAVGLGFLAAVFVYADASPGSIPRADAHH